MGCNLSSVIPVVLLLHTRTVVADALLKFGSAPEVETRSIDEIYRAALAEGGIVTVWHGGDERNQQDSLKQAFEERFPGITLNVTVDLSKYHDGAFDQQLSHGNVIVDSIILQTLHNYPRWATEGILLNYAPAGFDQIKPAFKDSVGAAWYGVYIYSWNTIWSTAKLPDINVTEWEDFLRPELKDKIVLTYPNDDDAVLYTFDIV
jgi:maltose-binding protein MalE